MRTELSTLSAGMVALVRTYPILRPDGSFRGFEITSSWFFIGPLLALLNSVDGVTEVRRRWFNNDRVTFKFHGKPAVVHEPYGDNSRFWVGLQDPDASPEIDIGPLQQAFKRYRGFPVVTLWPWGRHDG